MLRFMSLVIFGVVLCSCSQDSSGGSSSSAREVGTASAITTEPTAESMAAPVDSTHWEAAKSIQKALVAGQTPSEAEWAAFLDPISSVNVSQTSLRNSYELAFAPTRAEEAASLEGFPAILVSHLRESRERATEIDQMIEQMRGGGLSRVALERAFEWLPDSAREVALPFPIRLLPFGPEGYAEPASVLVDPLLLLQMSPGDRRGLVAHELHHVHVRAMEGQVSLAESDSDADLLAALRQLQLEGIADLIDKGPVPIEPAIPLLARMVENYNMAYARAPETVRAFDEQLRTLEGAEDRAARASAIRGSFVLAGHPDGHYMARTILDQLGREALQTTLPNPFAFVDAYQRAAQRDDEAPTLSVEAMAVLETLAARAISN